MQSHRVPSQINDCYDAMHQRNLTLECSKDVVHTQERGFVNENIPAYLSHPSTNFPSQSGTRGHNRDVLDSWRNDNERVDVPQLGNPGVQHFLPGSNNSAQLSSMRNLPQASQFQPVSRRRIQHQTNHVNRRTFDNQKSISNHTFSSL